MSVTYVGETVDCDKHSGTHFAHSNSDVHRSRGYYRANAVRTLGTHGRWSATAVDMDLCIIYQFITCCNRYGMRTVRHTSRTVLTFIFDDVNG